jgi:Phage Mu protein F like protein
MPQLEDILDDSDLWDSLKKKLLANNEELWGTVWASGGLTAYQLGAKRVAKELGAKPANVLARGKAYYAARGRKLTAQLTDTDLSQIRDLIEENWGIGEKAFAKTAQESILESAYRLANIYRTEIHYSNEHAGLDQAKEAEIETRSWVAMGDERMCEICSELEAENQEVPIDQPFTNEEMVAHAHCSCRCRALYGTTSPNLNSIIK